MFNIGLSGLLSRIAGSPFTGPGVNSNVAVLSPKDDLLFVSSQSSSTVTVISIQAAAGPNRAAIGPATLGTSGKPLPPAAQYAPSAA